jgi:hypothetical protein
MHSSLILRARNAWAREVRKQAACEGVVAQFCNETLGCSDDWLEVELASK